jgi:predicted nucleotidyltransferase
MAKESGPIKPLDELKPALQAACLRHDIVLAYLYGSQARGTAGPLSDVDVAVLFRPELSNHERFKQLLAVMGEFMDIFERDDVFVADLVDATPLLRFEVYRAGRLLYCQADEIRVRFMTEALRDYEDTRPLRQLQRDYLLQSIAEGTFGRKRAALAEKRAKYGAQ